MAPTYVFVAELTPVPGASLALVQPPDPSREGTPWGFPTDDFGNDLLSEYYRIGSSFGRGWAYYSNRNPGTNQWQRKFTFVKRVTSFGVPILIGAGYYLD